MEKLYAVLLLAIAATCSIEYGEATGVAVKGADLVGKAKLAISHLRNSQLSKAQTEIQALRKGGKELSSWANSQIKSLKDSTSRCWTKAEQIKTDIGNLATKENQLRNQLHSARSNLDTRKGLLKEKESELSSAQNSLSDARRRLEDAKDDDNDGAKIGAAIGAVLFGVFTGGAGAPLGAAIGGGLGKLVSELEDEVGKCRQRLDRAQDNLRQAESSYRSTESGISNVQTEISRLSSQIDSKKQLRIQYQEWEGNVKEVIAFLQRAATFWSEFSMLSDDGVATTNVLKKIVDKAEQMNDLRVLQARGGQRAHTTFIEVWEALEKKCASGGCTKYLQQNSLSC